MNNNSQSPYNFMWQPNQGGSKVGNFFRNAFGGGGGTGSQFMWGQGGGGEQAPPASTDNYVMAPQPAPAPMIGPQNQPPIDPSQLGEVVKGGAGLLGGVSSFLGSAATPLGIGLSLAGSVIGAVKARKEERRAKRQAKKAKKKMDSRMSAWENLDTSNPYLNMENTMEDLTINQKQAAMENQQFQQSQANILDSLRGSAGGGGVAALAQQMAQSGQMAAQRSAANIGDQERQNQMMERRESSRIQDKQIGGEITRREQMKDKTETMLAMSQQEYAQKKEQQAAAKQAKWDAITSGVSGAANMFAGFGQGT